MKERIRKTVERFVEMKGMEDICVLDDDLLVADDNGEKVFILVAFEFGTPCITGVKWDRRRADEAITWWIERLDKLTEFEFEFRFDIAEVFIIADDKAILRYQENAAVKGDNNVNVR